MTNSANPLKNDLLIRALRHQPVPRTPVWLMRQAGRYLPEYREVREQAGDIINLFKNPRLACEVTMQPLRRYPLDAAIIFSDILTIPDALGLGLHFVKGEGPQFAEPVRTATDIAKLPQIEAAKDLGYVMEAIQLTKAEIKQSVPLLGFSGSPWTLACYMVEGGGSKDFSQVKGLMYREPEIMQQLLQHLTECVVDYLLAQISAGVDAIMLFDTWGGVLTEACYQTFSLAYMQQIIERIKSVHADIPIILFTKGAGLWLETMVASGADALGLDWTIQIDKARAMVGDRVALQGNLDPILLFAKPDIIRQQVADVLERFGHGSGHVLNLGHGIQLATPPEHVAVFCQAVAELSPQYHT